MTARFVEALPVVHLGEREFVIRIGFDPRSHNFAIFASSVSGPPMRIQISELFDTVTEVVKAWRQGFACATHDPASPGIVAELLRNRSAVVIASNLTQSPDQLLRGDFSSPSTYGQAEVPAHQALQQRN